MSLSNRQQNQLLQNLIGVTGVAVGAVESIPMFVERLIKTGSLDAPTLERTISDLDRTRNVLGESGRTISNREINSLDELIENLEKKN